MSKVFSANISGVLVCVRVDKNEQLCDVQPRIGYVHSDFQGRPANLCVEELRQRIHAEISNMEEETVKSLIAGNKERAKQFKVKFKE